MSHRDRRTREILDAAYALVAEGGIEGTSLHGVARAIGVTTPALYRYFASRDALFAALEVEVLAELRALLGAAGSAADQSLALGALAAQMTGYGAWASRRPARFAVLHAIVGDPRRLVSDEHVGPVIEELARTQQVVAGVLRSAVASGALDDGDDLGRLLALWSSVHGLRASHKFTAHLMSPTRLASVAVELGVALCVGWGAPRADASAAFAAAAALDWDALVATSVLESSPEPSAHRSLS